MKEIKAVGNLKSYKKIEITKKSKIRHILIRKWINGALKSKNKDIMKDNTYTSLYFL